MNATWKSFYDGGIAAGTAVLICGFSLIFQRLARGAKFSAYRTESWSIYSHQL